MHFLPRRLYGQLVVLVVLILIMTVAAYGWFTGKKQVDYALNALKKNAEAMAKHLAISCADDLVVSNYARMETLLLSSADFHDIHGIRVCDEQGNVLSDIVHEPGSVPRTRFTIQKVSPPSSQEKFIKMEGRRMTIWQPIVAGSILGWVTIDYYSEDIDAMQRILWKNSLFVGMTGIVMSFGLLLVMLRRPARAIQRVTAFSKRLNEAKGDIIPVEHDFMEIEQLCEALNYASQKLAAAEQKLLQHQEHLEDLVALRTAETSKTNELLQKELAERGRAEARLRSYSKELMAVNEEMKNFAYIVSHDLRAPLVSIRGFAGELTYSLKELTGVVEKCLPHLNDRDRADAENAYKQDVTLALGFINSSVSRMDGLINAVLALSRLGRRELKPEPVDLTALAHSILKSLAHQIEKNNVSVSVAELPRITADRLSMEQIFGNLFDNALKYLNPGRDGELTVSAETGAGETTFHVRDNGRGIAADDMHKVFEIFRRVGTQDVPGEGMGLAYVKTLVKRHGGRIWCESEPGKGSTFSFTIPQSGEGEAQEGFRAPEMV